MKENTPKSTLLESVGVIEFCRTACADDAYNVAIARRMPRLLEFAGIVGRTGSNTKVITERALPWLQSLGSKNQLRIVDDVINIGTTISHYLDYASQRFPGVKTEVHVFAARKDKKPHQIQTQDGLKPHRFEFRTDLDERAYNRFETALPLELLRLGKPYDIDFPIIALPLKCNGQSKWERKWGEFLEKHYPSAHNLTVPSQRENGITSISLIDPLEIDIAEFLCLPPSKVVPSPKIRLYFSEAEGLVRIVPMYIPAISAAALEKQSFFDNGPLGETLRSVVGQAAKADPFPFEPIYNLIVYLASFEYGRQFMSSFRNLIDQDASGTPYLCRSDLDFLFGDVVADTLFNRLSDCIADFSSTIQIRKKVPDRHSPEKPITEEAKLVLDELLKRNFADLSAQSIFRETMRVLDEICQGNNPPIGVPKPKYARLRQGLPLWDIWWLVSKLSPSRKIGFEEMSFLLDFYIDVGAVVPVVEIVNSIYMRTYRRGESNPIEFATFVRNVLGLHQSVFPKNPLLITEFTKILAALAIYHPGKTPLVPMFEFRGTVPFIRSDDMEDRLMEEAVEFLKRKNAIKTIPVPERTDQIPLNI